MCFVSTALTYITLNGLEILMPYVNTVDIYTVVFEATVYRVE